MGGENMALGALGGVLGHQKEGGKTAGNNMLRQEDVGTAQAEQMKALLNLGNEDVGAQVQNDKVLGGLFGQGGTLQNTTAEEHRLANQGFQLTPEDHEAYGQASGDIARMFGQNDQSLAQALSDRGLSQSGAAGQAFSGSLGNKQEQLAKLQMNIANQRMQNNMQRLGQTRQFLGQLGQLGQNSEQAQYGRNLANSQSKFNMAHQMLGDYTAQTNTNLDQEAKTEHESKLSSAFNAAYAEKKQGDADAKSMAGSGMAMFSDKNLKTQIEPAFDQVHELLNTLTPYQYVYTSDTYGHGKHVSVMAQDLEKTDLGKQMVIDTPQGKIIDYAKGFGVLLASQVALNKRLNELESKVG